MISADLLFVTGDLAEEAGDFAAARAAFERGADLGDTKCLNRLGMLYDLGIGVPVDKAVAMRCYRRAWRLERCSTAAWNIAILYRERGEMRPMFRWFRRAEADGDGSVLLELARCYRDGKGVRKSAENAVRCLAQALVSEQLFDGEKEEAEIMMAAFRPRIV